MSAELAIINGLLLCAIITAAASHRSIVAVL